jgi:hypothetical protein
LEPIFFVGAIRTFVAFEALLNKITTSVDVENVVEMRLSIVSTVIFSVVIARKR